MGQGQDLRGFSWWGDAATYETFLGPNSSFPDVLFSPFYCINQPPNPPCTGTTTALPDNYGARSRHPGGVNVTMGDGSVRFVKNSIDIRSWRAISARGFREIPTIFFSRRPGFARLRINGRDAGDPRF